MIENVQINSLVILSKIFLHTLENFEKLLIKGVNNLGVGMFKIIDITFKIWQKRIIKMTIRFKLHIVVFFFIIFRVVFLFRTHFVGGGTIYSNGFFCSHNFGRSILSSYRKVSGIIKKSSSSIEFRIKKIFLNFFSKN